MSAAAEKEGQGAGLPAPAVSLAWMALLAVASCLAIVSYTAEHPRGLPLSFRSRRRLASVAAGGGPDTGDEGIPPTPIEIFTVLSGPYRMACTMLEGAVHNGIVVNVIGWGSPELNVKDFKRKEEKLKNKIPFLYRHLETWPNDTLIMFIDGGDIFWQSGVDALYTAYKQIATRERPIVFSAERNCWIRSLPRETCGKWPAKKNSPYRWLNSGAWMGPLHAVKELLVYANRSVQEITMENCNKCGDQAIFGKAYFADGWNKSVQLDHFCQIAQNLHSAEKDFDCDPVGGRVRNCVTNSVPPLFHFNGNPRHPALDPKLWVKKMWWQGRPVPRDAAVRVDGKLRFLDELCPALPYGESTRRQRPTAQLALPEHHQRLQNGLP
eukprot:gene193-311_t